MLPAQRNKVDISKLTPDEQKAFRMYGKLPAKAVGKPQERKYFDSGDWALSRSGKAEHAHVPLGKSVPKPEEIPHASPTPIGMGGSPGASGTPSSSSPPPAGTPLSPGSAAAQNIINMKSGHPSAISMAHDSSPDNAINLSMSPGRVGVGQPLATSPTRSFGSTMMGSTAADKTSPTTILNQNPLASQAQYNTSVLHQQAAQVAGTTGNQIGHMQIRRASESEDSAALASPGLHHSGLSHSTTAQEAREEDNVAEMEL